MLNTSIAQGPPITGDKPIMLGENSWVVKTLTELRWTKEGFFTRAPLMVHYLPTSNFLVGLHVPFVSYTYNDSAMVPSIGDIEILAKYQFYRKDGKAKTFRVVAKTIQTIPTGPKINQVGISTGVYSSYLALVAGYESIKYGISNELGYNISIDNQLNELRYKLGFGLPLLKPTYPVKQLNLYFEYQHSWFTTNNNFIMLYAQGIQYAKGRVTVEAAVQFPLIQLLPENRHRNISVLVGTRYVF
jgi:hypothetical protein